MSDRLRQSPIGTTPTGRKPRPLMEHFMLRRDLAESGFLAGNRQPKSLRAVDDEPEHFQSHTM